MLDYMSDYMSEYMPGYMSDYMSDYVSKCMSKYVSESGSNWDYMFRIYYVKTCVRVHARINVRTCAVTKCMSDYIWKHRCHGSHMESIKPCIFGANEFWSPACISGICQVDKAARVVSITKTGFRRVRSRGQVAPRNRWVSHPKSGHRQSGFYNDWVSVDPMEWNHSGSFFEVNVW